MLSGPARRAGPPGGSQRRLPRNAALWPPPSVMPRALHHPPPPPSLRRSCDSHNYAGRSVSVAFLPVGSLSGHPTEVGFLPCLRVCILNQALPCVAAPAGSVPFRALHAQGCKARTACGLQSARSPLSDPTPDRPCSPPVSICPLLGPPAFSRARQRERCSQGNLREERDLEREKTILGRGFGYQWQDGHGNPRLTLLAAATRPRRSPTVCTSSAFTGTCSHSYTSNPRMSVISGQCTTNSLSNFSP